MPSYDFRCDSCDREVVRVCRIAERNGQVCEECGKPLTRLFTMAKVHTFRPDWYEDICETPLYITSKRQLKEACDKHGVRAVALM